VVRLFDGDLEISSIDLEMFNIKVGFTASDMELLVSDIFSLEFMRDNNIGSDNTVRRIIGDAYFNLLTSDISNKSITEYRPYLYWCSNGRIYSSLGDEILGNIFVYCNGKRLNTVNSTGVVIGLPNDIEHSLLDPYLWAMKMGSVYIVFDGEISVMCDNYNITSQEFHRVYWELKYSFMTLNADAISIILKNYVNCEFNGDYIIYNNKVCLFNNCTNNPFRPPLVIGSELKGSLILPSGCLYAGAILDSFIRDDIDCIVFPESIRYCNKNLISVGNKTKEFYFSSKTDKETIAEVLGINALFVIGDDFISDLNTLLDGSRKVYLY
jgi:hypothetical protein